MYVDSRRLAKLLKNLGAYGERLEDYFGKISEFKEGVEYVLPLMDVETKMSDYDRLKERFHSVKTFWEEVRNFYDYLGNHLSSQVTLINI